MKERLDKCPLDGDLPDGTCKYVGRAYREGYGSCVSSTTTDIGYTATLTRSRSLAGPRNQHTLRARSSVRLETTVEISRRSSRSGSTASSLCR